MKLYFKLQALKPQQHFKKNKKKLLIQVFCKTKAPSGKDEYILLTYIRKNVSEY